MKKLVHGLLILTVFAVTIGAGACGGTGTSPSPTPAQTTGPASVPALSPTATGTTAGALATVGSTVYTNRCANCHGDSGQGRTAPAVIGSGAQMAKYNTAGGLYSKISTTMPPNAPGSLPASDYLSVTTYLLVENDYVNNGSQISSGQLDNIPLR